MDPPRTRLSARVVPSLLARDLIETIDFYGALGFELSGKHPETTPTWVELCRDGLRLQFHSEPPRGTPGAPVFSGTLYAYPGDVEALAQEWRGRVEFAWGPEVMDYGMREFAIRDPNGYFLAFTEPA